MDLGYFKRSRRRFTAWVITPLLVLCSVCLFWWFSSRATHEALEPRSAYMTLLPAMDQKLTTANALLNSFAIETADGAGIVDALTTDIQETAHGQAFTLNSLSFKETVPTENDPNPVVIWTGVVKGEGSLTAVVRFFSELYTRHRLMVVESTSLRSIGDPEDQQYLGEFRLRFFQVTLPNPVELAHQMEATRDES